MDELVDFEELIDLNLSLPSVSKECSQELIADVLDKMCEAMGESNFTMNTVIKNNENETDETVPNDNIVNLDAFENLLVTASLCNDESNLVTEDMLDINEEKNGEIVPNDDVIDLDEFENLLATSDLCNDEINSITDDLSQINEKDLVKMAHDVIDLDEFASISTNACLFIDGDASDDSKVSDVQRILSYEVPVEFDCDNTTEDDVVKTENVTNTNTFTVNKQSLDFTATSNVREQCIDLDTFGFDVNPIHNKLKIVKEYENKLETVTEERKMEININEGEDIVTLTINDSEVKYENAVIPPKTDCKYTINAVTEDSENKNADSDDGYDSSDFEFISEIEASKAGIVTRIRKITINNTNNIETTESTSKNANSVTQHKQNSGGSNRILLSIDRPRKNEACLSDYAKYSKCRYQRCYSRPASQFHEIPQGESYLDMFRGKYAPEVVNNLYSLTNKRVLSAVAMAANFEELAYRDPGQEDENNEKYKDDAEECLQKIVSTYRYENRRKRRRH